MSSATLLRLPTAAPYPPPRKSWPGALPKTVARYRVARFERLVRLNRRDLIEGEIARLQGLIADVEEFVSNCRAGVLCLRQAQPGTDLELRVTAYLEWRNLAQSDKDFLQRTGHAPPECPF